MHLPELPTIFVKNGEERKAFFTIQARELLAAGWTVKGAEEVKTLKVEVKEQSAPEETKEQPAKTVKPRTRTRTKKAVKE